MKASRIVLGLVAVVAVGAAALYAFRVPLSLAVASRVAASRMQADLLNDLPDGLHAGLCGAGSPFPDDKRSGPCVTVVAGKRLFVVDTGSGSTRNIGKLGFNTGRISAIFLTHFHSDHIDGLGELMLQRWVSAGNKAPVPVYGPPGVDDVVAGFNQAYRADHGYRVAHHGAAILPPDGFGGKAQAFTVEKGEQVVFQEDGIEVTAFAVDHAPVHPAVGYRFRYKGRSLVVSGDTKKSAAVQAAAQGADLLLHEALSTPLVNILGESAGQAGRANLKKLFADIIDYHSSPEEAATVARDAGVGALLMYHIAPPLPLPGMEAAFLGKSREIFTGPLTVGADGDFISLPAGSKEIRASRRF